MERGFLKHLYKHILAFEPIICGYFWAIIIVLSQSVGFLRLALWVWDSWGIYIYTISHHINPSIRKGDWSSKTHFKAFHPRISGKKYDHPSSFLTSAVSQKVRDSNKNGGDSPLFSKKNTEVDEVGYSSGPAQPQMWLLRLDTRPLLQGGSGDCVKTRWWFQRFIFSPRSLGRWSNLTSIIFSDGLKPSIRQGFLKKRWLCDPDSDGYRLKSLLW